MKLTLRRNGRKMTTVTTAHHIGSAELAKMLCRFEGAGYGVTGPDVYGKDPDREIPLTRGVLGDTVRSILEDWGRDAYQSESNWAENYSKAEAAILAAWAVREIRRLYPGLDDDALRLFEAEYDADGPDITTVKACATCGGKAYWHDESWVCDDCGDEFYDL